MSETPKDYFSDRERRIILVSMLGGMFWCENTHGMPLQDAALAWLGGSAFVFLVDAAVLYIRRRVSALFARICRAAPPEEVDG